MDSQFLSYFYENDYHKSRKQLWELDSFDFVLFTVYLATFFLIWITTSITSDIYTIMSYWDGPNYVYAAKTFYNIPEDNPWSRYFGMQPSYFACHLPGFPLIIKVFALLFFGNYWIGDILAILSTSFLSIYLFRRLLLVYHCVKYPRLTSLLSLFLPIRMVIYRNVGASEPLYISLVFLAFILYKQNKKFYMILTMWYASLTRIEGLSIVGTIGLCYLLKLDILSAIFTSLGFFGFFMSLLFHKIKFGDFLAYFNYNQSSQHLLSFPFSNIIEYTFSIRAVYRFLLQHIIMLIGLIKLYKVSLPLSIFSTVYFLYSTSLNHMDVYRYSLPGYILCLLIGLDALWSSNRFRKHLIPISLFYLFSLLFYANGQITTNVSGIDFLKSVMI